MGLVTCLWCQHTTDLRGVFKACPQCGENSGFLNVVNFSGIEIFPSMHLTVKNSRYKGRRKYAREIKSSAEHSADGQFVRVEQSIDREHNSYRKSVTNIDTGQILRKVDHPLTEHTGHGSDKPSQK